MKKLKLQSDYTVFGAGCQLCFSLNREIVIPKNDPVRLLNAVIERMDMRKLAATYPAEGKIEHEPVCEDLQRQITEILISIGEVSFAKSAVFIDGTKIEANANRYTFVWKRTTIKNYEKLQAKMKEELPKIVREQGLHFYVPEEIRVRNLKKILKKLKEKAKKESIVFVKGKGKHKTTLQRAVETVAEWISRAK